MENIKKLEVFFEIAGCFNEKLDSVPVLYGSLGLCMVLGNELVTEDIDLLLEHQIFSRQNNKIRVLMESMGFNCTCLEENEYQRGVLKVGISHDGDMIEFSGVNPSALAVVKIPVKHRVLNTQEYLKTYKASSLDGYRREKRQKNDAEKIIQIEAYLSGSK